MASLRSDVSKLDIFKLKSIPTRLKNVSCWSQKFIDLLDNNIVKEILNRLNAKIDR